MITDDMEVVRPSHADRRLGYWLIIGALCVFFSGLYGVYRAFT